MDLKDKIIGMALAALIALVGWNLHETWGMKEQVFKLQQGQEVLSKQIKKNSAFVKQKLKQIKKKHAKKIINKESRRIIKRKRKKRIRLRMNNEIYNITFIFNFIFKCL